VKAVRTWLAKLRGRGLIARAGFLAIVVLGVYVLVAPVVAHLKGSSGLAAAAAAAGACLAGAVPALVASRLLRGTRHALCGMLLAMALRFAVPLGIGLGCHLSGGPLAEGGILYYLLVFYPITLGVETALSLPPAEAPGQHPKTFQGVL
jgi:hypothetical protein